MERKTMQMTYRSSFDWWGTDEELKEVEKQFKEAAEKVDSVTYHGLYVPHNSKFHYVRVWTGDDWDAFWSMERPKRDKKKLSHVVFEYMTKAQI